MTISSYTGWAKEGLFMSLHAQTREWQHQTLVSESIFETSPKWLESHTCTLMCSRKMRGRASHVLLRYLWGLGIFIYICIYLHKMLKIHLAVRILCTIRDYEFSGRSFYWKWAKTRTVGKLCRQCTAIFIKYRCFPGASKNPEETS